MFLFPSLLQNNTTSKSHRALSETWNHGGAIQTQLNNNKRNNNHVVCKGPNQQPTTAAKPIVVFKTIYKPT